MENLQTLYNKLKNANIVVPSFDTFQQRYGSQQGMQSLHSKLKNANVVVPELEVFTSKYLTTSVQQQPVETKPQQKPVQSQPKEDKGWFDKSKEYLSNLFGSSEDLTQKVNNNLTENTVNLQNIKDPTKPVKEDVTEMAKTGFKPGTSFIEQKELLNNNYNDNIKKINDKYIAILSMAGATGEDINVNNLPPNLKLKYNQEINSVKTKYQTDFNILKANPSNEDVKVDDNTKQIKTAQITSNIKNINNKLKETKEKSFLDFIPEDTNINKSFLQNVFEKAFQPLIGLNNAYKGYTIKQDAVNNLEGQKNIGKKDLEYLNKYNLDIEQTLQNASPERRLQMEMSLNPELKGFGESAKKYSGREDKTYIRDILDNPFFGKEVTINNLTSETDQKKFYEKLTNIAKSRTDFYTSSAKDKLQEELVQSKLDNIFDVNSPQFNTLIENYETIAQNPQLIFNLYPDKNPQEVFNKLAILNKNPEFQKIVNTDRYFNQINDERVNNNLKQFTKEKIAGLKNLNYLEALGKTQQLKEDYIEQQAMKDGILSLANAKFIGTQLLEAKDYVTNTGKSYAGTLAGLATGDKYEYTRELQAKADAFKAINFPQDESELSPFADSKWIVIPTKDGSNYQIAVNDQGDFLTARSHNLSLPVNDPQKLKELQDFFMQNRSSLLKNTKNLSEIDGGYSAMAGYIGSQVAVGALEEIPSAALEAGLAYVSEGAGSGLLVKRLAKWGNKLKDLDKAKDRYDKISRFAINGLSTYAEIGYGVKKSYEEQGLDPSFYNTLITSGALTTVAQLTPALENTYQKLGSKLAGKEFKEEVNNLLVKDMPDVIKTLSGATVNIADKKVKDYIFNKELRNYVLERVAGVASKVGKKLSKEGLQEASEETILEPIAQVFANAANAGLTGNDLYNKESLKDLGFLDPETALIAGLTGGVMATGVDKITDLVGGKENAFNSMNNLQAAINNPGKFKAYLSTYLNNQDDEPNKNLNQEQYNNIINNFDTIANNYNATKQSYGFNNDFVSKFNLDNPAQEQLFKNIGVTKENITNFNGEKTLNNLILQNEVNKITSTKVAEELTNNIGLDVEGQKTLQPLLDNNGMVSLQKIQEQTGQKEFDQDTLNSIRTYNTNVAKDLKIKNALNLFNQNFSGIQDKFVNTYQQTLLNNPDLASPELGIYDNAYQNKLFDKLINDKRIDEITNQLAIGEETLENTQLKEELDTLMNENKELEKGLNEITNTYKEGFLDTQNEINTLTDNFNTVNTALSQYLTDYFSGSVDNFLDLNTEDINELDEQAANKLNDLIEDKSKKLKDLKTAFNNANKKYNNAIFSSIINNNNIKELENSIKKDKELLNKIKEQRKLYTKLRKGKISFNQLLTLKNNNNRYNEEAIKNNVLPYFINFSKNDMDNKFNEDPDLLLAFYSILEDLNYLPELDNYRKNYTDKDSENIDLNYLSGVVQDSLIKLGYNVALLNSNRDNEILSEFDKEAAVLVNNIIQNKITDIEENNLDEQLPTVPEIETSDKQQETIDLITQNTISLQDAEVTDKHYIINDQLYKKVTSIESTTTEDTADLTAEENVNNFLDKVGRIIFSNNNINTNTATVVFNEVYKIFANKGIIINIDLPSYMQMFNTMVNFRNELTNQGFIFFTNERIAFNKFDGSNFSNLTEQPNSDDSVGIASTLNILAINSKGEIDVINLSTVLNPKSKLNKTTQSNTQSSVIQKLAFAKTMLEKINNLKVNTLKLLQSKVDYNVNQDNNNITNLKFAKLTNKNIKLTKQVLEIINKYLSVPNFVVTTPIVNVENVVINVTAPEIIVEEFTPNITPTTSGNSEISIKTEEEKELLVEDNQNDSDFVFVDDTQPEFETIDNTNFVEEIAVDIESKKADIERKKQEAKLNSVAIPQSYKEAADDYKGSELGSMGEAPKLKQKVIKEAKTKQGRQFVQNQVAQLNYNEDGTITVYRSGSLQEGHNPVTTSREMAEIIASEREKFGLSSEIIEINVNPEDISVVIPGLEEELFIEVNQSNKERLANNTKGDSFTLEELEEKRNVINNKIKEAKESLNNLENDYQSGNFRFGEERYNSFKNTLESKIKNLEWQLTKINAKYNKELVQPTFEGTFDPITETQTPVNESTINQDQVEDNLNLDNNPNILALNRYTYVRFIGVGPDQYMVAIDNNNTLNDKFNKQIFTREELKNAFDEEGLFFDNGFDTYESVGNVNVYILRNKNNNSPIPSFLQTNVLDKLADNLPYDLINSLNNSDLLGLEGQVVALNTTDNWNKKLSKEEFLEKSALGLVVNGQLVSIIRKNDAVRKNLEVVFDSKIGSFTVKPFNVKISKIKKGGFLFNPKINNNINNVKAEANKLGFTKSILGFVGIENDQKVFKTKDQNGNAVVVSNVQIKKSPIGSVHLILMNDKNEMVKIPLKTPTLKEVLKSVFNLNDNEIEDFKQNTFISNLINFSAQGNTVQNKYLNFLDTLKDIDDPRMQTIYNIIPQSLGDEKYFTPNQKNKFKLLSLNFNTNNLFDFLLNTLVTLNNETEQFYYSDLDLENFYSDNSVVITYDNMLNKQDDVSNQDIDLTQSSAYFNDVQFFC